MRWTQHPAQSGGAGGALRLVALYTLAALTMLTSIISSLSVAAGEARAQESGAETAVNDAVAAAINKVGASAPPPELVGAVESSAVTAGVPPPTANLMASQAAGVAEGEFRLTGGDEVAARGAAHAKAMEVWRAEGSPWVEPAPTLALAPLPPPGTPVPPDQRPAVDQAMRQAAEHNDSSQGAVQVARLTPDQKVAIGASTGAAGVGMISVATAIGIAASGGASAAVDAATVNLINTAIAAGVVPEAAQRFADAVRSAVAQQYRNFQRDPEALANTARDAAVRYVEEHPEVADQINPEAYGAEPQPYPGLPIEPPTPPSTFTEPPSTPSEPPKNMPDLDDWTEAACSSDPSIDQGCPGNPR